MVAATMKLIGVRLVCRLPWTRPASGVEPVVVGNGIGIRLGKGIARGGGARIVVLVVTRIEDRVWRDGAVAVGVEVGTGRRAAADLAIASGRAHQGTLSAIGRGIEISSSARVGVIGLKLAGIVGSR